MASPVMYTGADISINNLTFNQIDSNGVRWFVEDIDGWWGLPEDVIPSSPLSLYQDGSDYLAGRYLARNMTMTGYLMPVDNRTGIDNVIAARRSMFLALNTVRSSSLLTVNEYDATKQAVVQIVDTPKTSFNQLNGKMSFSISMRAVDPRKYAAALSSVSTIIYTAPGGRAYNRVYSWSYGASGSIGTLTVNNLGSTDTSGVLRIQGPVTNPSVIQLETGNTLTFNIVLAASDYLTIDLSTRTVILNGTASRRSSLASNSVWFSFVPGTSTLRYVGTPGDIPATSLLTATYRSAWLE